MVHGKIELHRIQSGTVLMTEPHLGTSAKSLVSENSGSGNHIMWTILRTITWIIAWTISWTFHGQFY